MTGVRRLDDLAANKAAGLRTKTSNTTWHHHEDGQTMVLVPWDLHDAIKHTGGVAALKSQI